MYYLYRKEPNTLPYDLTNDFLEDCVLNSYSPSFKGLSLDNEDISFKSKLARLYFVIITKNNLRIFYIKHKDEIIHTAFVTPNCSKFPFMTTNDYQIGPCVTNEKYRRKGCYIYMLNYITSISNNHEGNYYMLVNENNKASILGIEKSGFRKVGNVRKTFFLKRYIEVK